MTGLGQADKQAYLGRPKSFIETPKKNTDEDSEPLVYRVLYWVPLVPKLPRYVRPGSSVSARTRGHTPREATPEQLRKLLDEALKQNAELKAELRSSKLEPSADGFSEKQFQADMERAMEESRASAGLSCSSRPGSVAVSDDEAAQALDGEELPSEEEFEEALDEAPEEAPCNAGKAEIPDIGPTSTTHRREYMQLSRKMEGIDASRFPEVSALWSSGSKKERHVTGCMVCACRCS